MKAGPPAGLSTIPLTQQLVLETLAARHRTGEKLYVLPATATQAVNALDRLGLVWQMSGNVEHSIRAGLTVAGVKMMISPTYETPIEAELRMIRGQLDELRELRRLEAGHRF